MEIPFATHLRAAARAAALLSLAVLAACGDDGVRPTEFGPPPANAVAALRCTASVAQAAVSCESIDPATGVRTAALPGAPSQEVHIVGGQGTYIRLASSNVTYAGGTFAFDVTVQNLSDQAMGTADGATPHADGVRVFFHDGPTTTGGSGTIEVSNATGTATFTASGQEYFQYDGAELGADGILASAETSSAKSWQLSVPAEVTTFSFVLYVATETPSGSPLASVAPQVTSISPATLVPGTSATLTGTGFDATPASNTVTIGGVAAAVTAATATSLTVTVPCVASGTVPVQVAQGGMKGGAFPHPLQVAQRTLAVGETVVLTSAADVACNELTASGGPARYIVSVFNATTSTSANAPFFVSGDAPETGAALARAPTTPDFLAQPTAPTSLAARQEIERARRADEAHTELLERNAQEYERLNARFAGDPRMRPRRSAVSADPVEPPLNRKIRVARIDGANFCRTFTEVNATRVYYGGKIAIYEDADSTPVALRAANNPKMAEYYQKIGDQFNADMEPIISGSFSDILRRDAVTDNNGVLVAFFTPVINRRSPGVAGFVVSCDQFPNDSTAATPTNSSSNFGEYFYAYQPTDSTGASGYGTFTPDSWYWSIRATFIHETKHAAAYAYRASVGAPFETSWLEEGTARHAEELWARNAIYNVAWKGNTGYGSAAAPGSIYCDWRREAAVAGGSACLATNSRRPSLNMYRHFQSLYNFMVNGRFYSLFGSTTDDTGSNWYATSWSLVRFATDRYGASDAAFLSALTQSSQTSTTNVANRAGVSFTQLMGEWSLALAMDDYPGMTPLPSTPQMPTWNMRDIYTGMNSDPLLSFSRQWPLRLANTTPLTFGSVAPFNVPTLRGGGVAWFEISGSHTAPQLIRLGGGTAAAPIALGSTIRIAIGRVE